MAYLVAHTSQCDRSACSTVCSEETLVGWDAAIGDVIFMKPDEILKRNDGALILREIKTTSNPGALDPTFAWDQFADVANWWAAALRGGLIQHFGAASAVLELEILTPDGVAVHRRWLADPGVDFQIEGWLLDAPTLWLADRAFPPCPGTQCAQCEVIRWCRDGQDFA